MQNNPNIPNNWCVIGIPDDLSHWNLGELMQHVEAIITNYGFNRAEHTHCCELLPSYCLDTINREVICKDGTPDDIRDSVHSEVMGAGPDEISYIHVADIEERIKNNPKLFHSYGPGEQDDDQKTCHGTILPEWLVETWQSNPKF